MKKTKMFDAMAQIDDQYIDRCLAQKQSLAESGNKGSEYHKKPSSRKVVLLIASFVLICVLTLSVIMIVHYSNKLKDPASEDPGEESQADSYSESHSENEPSENGESKNMGTYSDLSGTDLTVAFETFSPSSFRNTLQTSASTDFATIYSDISDLYASSDNVVYGTVKSVAYWDLSGTAHTIYSFNTSKVIKGDIPEKAVISVITPGGYCRLRSYVNAFGKGKYETYSEQEIDETIFHDSFAGVTDEPAAGDQYLLYLSSPLKDEEPFPDGLYCEVGSFMGRLVEGDDGMFNRVLPQNEPSFYGDSMTAYSREYVFDMAETTEEIQERLDTFSVDEETAKNMSSSELLKTIMDYPYIGNTFPGLSSDAHASYWLGIITVRGYYPPLDIFLERPDAESVLLEYIDYYDHNDDAEEMLIPCKTRVQLAKHFLSYLQSEESA